jgi:uncharacterized damage-inducible protein DinB
MELDHLAASLGQLLSGEPWHGPSIAALLADVTAQEASAHPVAGAHSIIELVLHVAAWTQEVAARLRGRPPGLPAIGDWPACSGDAGLAWATARQMLDEAHADLLGLVQRLPAERLAEWIGETHDPPLGSGVPVAVMLAGLAQHDAYHGGQIAILKHALAARGAGRA